MDEIDIKVVGMHCVTCVKAIQRALNKVSGVKSAEVDFTTSHVRVFVEEGFKETDKLLEAVGSVGYHAELWGHEEKETSSDVPSFLQQPSFVLFFIAALLTAPLFFHMLGSFFGIDLYISPYMQLAFATIVQFLCGRPFYIGAWYSLKALSPNMDLLVALGTSSAYFYSIYQLFYVTDGDLYFETSAAVITIVLLGRFIEGSAKEKATLAASALLQLKPKKVQVEKEGKIEEIHPNQLRVGDIFFVRPGENIAVDGVVISGESSVDESFLTGEAFPQFKEAESTLFSGTKNQNGLLKAQATRVGKESTLEMVVALVEKMHNTKAPIQRIADQVAEYFVPFVVGVALLAFLIWWLVFGLFDQGVIAAVATLVIACPCALGIATPIVLLVSSGIGSQLGLFFQDAKALEYASKINQMVFDKTGTITQGSPLVKNIVTFHGFSEEKLMGIMASVETFSEHPLAKAIVSEAKKLKSLIEPVSDLVEIPGKGVCGVKRGVKYFVGSLNYAISEKIEIPEELSSLKKERNQSLVILMDKSMILGAITVVDPIRPEALDVIKALRKKNIEVLLLSGDKKDVAESVAHQLGLTQFIGEVLPEKKVDVVLGLKDLGKILGVCGDGINDAPALAAADVSFAIGAGSDIAIAAADITLMHSDLKGILYAIELSSQTVKKIKQNLFLAFIYNVIAIPIAASGLLSPIIASLAMVLSSLSVVINAYLFRKWKPPSQQ
ncbi:heavy metal translocating P-type ATPase [Chlamydiales bacterium]|nr:heavy metal translocating P-type ATPase [Chlamydiales bacterium]